MKVRIRDVDYELADVLNRTDLAGLMELKVKTGIGMRTLQRQLIRLGTFEDPLDFMEDEDGLRAINALIWLCRRRGGERLSLEEAGDVRLDEFAFIVEAEDTPPVAPDPPEAPTVSGRGAAAARPKKAAKRTAG